ncbi:MAG: 50S ribosomal protein L5 [Acidobacteriota bacterium]|nr:50S ribosomal protein L5 [Acidobacteriota bacterium]
MARLLEKYRQEILPALQSRFNYSSPMAVPRLEKIVVNMGVGEARENIKLLDTATEELSMITGQRAVMTRAKKSIANFKIRQKMPIGCMVTLRGNRMYEFFDRLVSIALPRVRDFRGVSTGAFDGRGNYTLGVQDALIFPEVTYGRLEKVKGMNVSIVTTARSDDESRALLELMGMPFRKG